MSTPPLSSDTVFSQAATLINNAEIKSESKQDNEIEREFAKHRAYSDAIFKKVMKKMPKTLANGVVRRPHHSWFCVYLCKHNKYNHVDNVFSKLTNSGFEACIDNRYKIKSKHHTVIYWRIFVHFPLEMRDSGLY